MERRRADRHEILVHGDGWVPLNVRLYAAKRPDVEQLLPLTDTAPPKGRHAGDPQAGYAPRQWAATLPMGLRSGPTVCSHQYRWLKFRNEVRDDIYEAPASALIFHNCLQTPSVFD